MTFRIITPNPALDRTMIIRQLQIGAVLRAERVMVQAGGKGLNVARAAQTLGLPSLVYAPLGGHSGRWFAQLAADEGFSGRWSPIESETRTCVLVIDRDGGDATALNERGPELSAAEWAVFVESIEGRAREPRNQGTKEPENREPRTENPEPRTENPESRTTNRKRRAQRGAYRARNKLCALRVFAVKKRSSALSAFSAVQNTELRIVALCGSLPPGVPAERYGELVQRVQAQGERVIVDTSGAALRAAFASRPWAVKVNAHELSELLGCTIKGVEEAAVALKELRRCVQLAVVTLGAQGALAASDEGCWWACPPAIDLVSSVGSGDSLLAGLCCGLLRGQALAEALRLGVACGSANALTIGGGLIELATVERLAAETRVVSLS